MFNQKFNVMKNSLKIFAILILSAVMISFIESRNITGKVSDDQGKVLAGVSVSVKGSANGTITDLNGNYKITVKDQDKVLVFSLVGYQSVEKNISGKSIINVTMSPELVLIEEL